MKYGIWERGAKKWNCWVFQCLLEQYLAFWPHSFAIIVTTFLGRKNLATFSKIEKTYWRSPHCTFFFHGRQNYTTCSNCYSHFQYRFSTCGYKSGWTTHLQNVWKTSIGNQIVHSHAEKKLLVSRQSFGPEFCVVWPRKMPASGWGSLWESSSFIPWFPTFVFRNVPGTGSECVRICWFKRNSSNLDRAPKMRESVLLNSWHNFLLTLPSISSESCVIYSSLILGTDVFRGWPFLGFSSCISLVTAANFRLFLNVAIFLEGKCYAVMKTELVLYLLINLRW